MALTVLQQAINVRERLADPLPQAPSYARILSELEVAYQYATNRTNNTGNAWQLSSFTFNSVAGQRQYQFSAGTVSDFYKALKVVTVPSNADTFPEFELEFVEMEHFAQEWAWLSQNNGELWYSSHDAQLIAFFRKMGTSGAELWCEIRPVPSEAQTYKVLYQQSDWWGTAMTAGSSYTLPHPSQARYMECLAALNLLPECQWCFDDAKNMEMAAKLAAVIEKDLQMHRAVFEQHISTLESQDVIEIEDWADRQGMVF